MDHFTQINAITKNLFSNKLIKSSILVSFASMFGNVFSYLFQVVAGRSLNTENFAELTSLLASFNIIMIIVTILGQGLVKTINDEQIRFQLKKHKIYFTGIYLYFMISASICVALLLSQEYFSSYIGVPTSIVNHFIVFVFVSIIAGFFVHYFQGAHNFLKMSILIVLAPFLKLSILYLFLKFEDSVSTKLAILSLSSSSLAFTLIAIILTYREHISNSFQKFHKLYAKKIVRYAMGSLLTVIGITLLQNLDIILVKHFFKEYIAGEFAYIATLGKVIFYVVIPIQAVMFPICAKQYSNKKNFITPFITAMILIVVTAGTTTAIFSLFPSFFTKLLFDMSTKTTVALLPIYALNTLVLAINYSFLAFYISISKFNTGYISIIAAVLLFVLINSFHNSLNQVIYITLYINTSSFLIYTFIFFKIKQSLKFKNTKQSLQNGNIVIT